MNLPGKLIVIEGGEGTGKTEQTKLLVTRLHGTGHAAAEYDFPRYGKPPLGHPASFFIRKYLQKEEFGFKEGYGPAISVNPYAASLSYAIERFDASFCQEYKPNLRERLASGEIIISNRYTPSNIGFQASKIDDPNERREFILWLMDIEYNKLQIPEPGLVILLNLDPKLALELKVAQRRKQGLPLDAHEKDSEIIFRAHRAYIEAVSLFTNTWVVVDVANHDHSPEEGLSAIRSREDIHEEIWGHVRSHIDSNRG